MRSAFLVCYDDISIFCVTSTPSTTCLFLAGGLPQQFLLSVYVITDNGNERNLVANMTANVPRFSVPNLQPGSHYIGEIVGFNVKGTGVPTLIKVYTLKLPEKLIPPIVSTPAKGKYPAISWFVW